MGKDVKLGSHIIVFGDRSVSTSFLVLYTNSIIKVQPGGDPLEALGTYIRK